MLKYKLSSVFFCMSKPLYVTQPYLPDKEKYYRLLDGVFERNQLTNGGPLLEDLTGRLKQYLGVKYLLLVANGTLALQLAYKMKGIANRKVLTTPYTFAATATALDWQGAQIEFSDIDPQSWNLCPKALESHLSKEEFGALVPVNLFGMPCHLDALETLRERYKVPIIYDSAHALVSRYKGKSIFEYGDIHCISFHATKLFHTVEGGAMIFRDEADYERAKRLINFGQDQFGNVSEAGINAKMSEVHAAMGLCVLDDLDTIIANRQNAINIYKERLKGKVQFQSAKYDQYTTPMYMPVAFKNEEQLKLCIKSLNDQQIYPRKYFSPEALAFTDISLKKTPSILCLPLFYSMPESAIAKIANCLPYEC
ncbi:DegT/DnrJ/EryC1/StrS family aminotransferase [Pseudoalteromonas pernae]|uniref:DegT/DnrJ/EryC1/StrS family aminotransferase n=1 Tax=Pseudoalteromonas pernae TaxID=3118054 RepID=UPI00324224F4